MLPRNMHFSFPSSYYHISTTNALSFSPPSNLTLHRPHTHSCSPSSSLSSTRSFVLSFFFLLAIFPPILHTHYPLFFFFLFSLDAVCLLKYTPYFLSSSSLFTFLHDALPPLTTSFFFLLSLSFVCYPGARIIKQHHFLDVIVAQGKSSAQTIALALNN